MKRWLLLIIAAVAPAVSAADPPDCLPSEPVPLIVRFGKAAPTLALLKGGTFPPLRVVDADSGQTLWSAGTLASASQPFPDMHAAFAGSLAAIDTDGDGLHDRLYAGDLLGRIWRFDLHHGAEPGEWATGGIFADFSNPAGRGFLARPDISLSKSDGEAPWLNVAIGTAAPANSSANNRYYVLRDHAVFESWTNVQYQRWTPLRESDLLRLTHPSDAPTNVIRDGYFIELGRGDILAASLTVSGRAVLAISESSPAAAAHCRVTVSIATFDLDHAAISSLDAIAAAGSGHWRWRLPLPVPANAAFALTEATGAGSACWLDTVRITACDVNTRPVKTWWRRSGAE